MAAVERKMTEEQAVNLIRNSLMVAGQEMGAEGDHWPVIKSSVQSLLKDFEDLQIARNVHEELKTHIGDIVKSLEAGLVDCPQDLLPEMTQMVKEVREIYEAHFSDIDESQFYNDPNKVPTHMKRTKAILKTLEDDDA